VTGTSEYSLDTARAKFGEIAGSFADPEAVFRCIRDSYAEPHRRYHTLSHIVEMLACFEQSEALASDYTAIALAVWFHDIVYEVGKEPGDNELASAALLESVATGTSVDAASRFIKHSASHDITTDGDTRLFCDLDLYRLGAPYDTYVRHSQNIRHEYSYLSEAEWRQGRCGFLRKILARPQIFQTEFWHTRCERQARSNIAGEIRRLSR